jgi:hypothetical protein
MAQSVRSLARSLPEASQASLSIRPAPLLCIILHHHRRSARGGWLFSLLYIFV